MPQRRRTVDARYARWIDREIAALVKRTDNDLWFRAQRPEIAKFADIPAEMIDEDRAGIVVISLETETPLRRVG